MDSDSSNESYAHTEQDDASSDNNAAESSEDDL
jgi:hypothetical protein